MKTVIAIVVVLAKVFLLLLLMVYLPARVSIMLWAHQTVNVFEELNQMYEELDNTGSSVSVTSYMVEDLDIGRIRQIGQELDADIEETLVHLQEPDGEFWLPVLQGDLMSAMSVRIAKRLWTWNWIGIAIHVVLIAVGYLAYRTLKVPRSAEVHLEPGVKKNLRYGPLLAILLSGLFIGMRISENIRISKTPHAFYVNRDAVILDCNRIVAGARQWYRKSVEVGGGGESWSTLSFEVLPIGSSTPHGSYAFTSSEGVLTVIGRGVVEGSDGKVPQFTLVYDAVADSAFAGE